MTRLIKSFLLCCVAICIVNGLFAQSGARNKFEKYIDRDSVTLNISGSENLLVEFKRPLKTSEIEKINPLRILNGNFFVVKKDSLTNYKSIIVSSNKVKSIWKASDHLLRLWEEKLLSNDLIMVRLLIGPSFLNQPEFLKKYKTYSIDSTSRIITIQINIKELPFLMENSEVLFADIVQIPNAEAVVNELDLSAIEVSGLHRTMPDLDGKNIMISIKENLYDATDIDLLGKGNTILTGSGIINSHATTMATLAAGRGNSFIYGLGVAPAASLSSSDFKNLMPDNQNQLIAGQVNVQNHSYGTDIENMYGMEASAYDKQIFEMDTLVHVFSAGNKGDSAPQSGLYQGISNYANLTGNFKQSKNVMVIGGVNRSNILESLSSRGPAYDGRVKPDLVAIGEDGTSGSAALTSGVVALFMQKYKELYSKAASNEMVKAVLINAADDLGSEHVDFSYGYGKVNALQAINTLVKKNLKQDKIETDQDYSFPIDIIDEDKDLKITLAWSDPEAVVNSPKSIVNHLDLFLETPEGKIILPWVLNTFPHPDSLASPAKRGRDDLNNIQQVTLDKLQPGRYRIHVRGRKIVQGVQNFAIAYQVNKYEQFAWTFPEAGDQVFANRSNYIRWNQTFQNKRGNLWISLDQEQTWQSVAKDIKVDDRFFNLIAPDFFGKAKFKMEIDGKEFKSNTFIISSPLELQIGYNCDTELLFHWKPQKSSNGYSIYTIKNNTLSVIAKTADTLIKISKNATSSPYFSISADGPDFTGLKSYTIDSRLQGISCYVQSLTGNRNDQDINLKLNIGTTYNLKNITWQEQVGVDTFQDLNQNNIADGQLNYNYVDQNVSIGVHRYRVKFTTSTNQVIYSDLINVDFLNSNDYILFPNPINSILNVKTEDFDTYRLTLYNIVGQKVFEEEAYADSQFNLSNFSPGVYIATIIKKGVVVFKQKVLKY